MTKEEALEILHNSSVYNPLYLDALNMAIEALEEQRPKGKWLDAKMPQHYYCSVCGGMHHSARYGDWREIFEFKYPYCPLCGIEMEV